MATHDQQTIDSTPPAGNAASAQFVEYEEFIENQLRKTGGQVRGVDFAAGLMVLFSGTLVFFLLAAVIDHWVVFGGLGFWGRLTLLVVYLAGAGWWTTTQLLPLLIKRINPLYAALTIERSRPSLKNSLVNFLLFRSDSAGVHKRVLEAIEEQAATNLVAGHVESAVDSSRLIKLGYVLIGILMLCALYALIAPKNLFKTVGRVVMPWAEIQAPTRATIDEIEPGDVQAFRGQQVTVKARVQGVADDAPVTLYYSTADRQIVDRPVEMIRGTGDYRYAAVLPANDAALQQSLSYTIRAGDASSRTFQVEVVAAPTIVVSAVEYKYPDYTGLLSQRVEHQGDLKAIEGTEVTIEALANQDIASAYIDFDANHTLDLPLRGEGPTAKTSFRLGLKDDRQTPQHASYQLLFKNAAGQENPQPVRHLIEVSRDLSPEIQFVAPQREEIELPLDDVVDLEVVANDPDFALAKVTLLLTKGNKKLAEETLLNETWRGQFVKKYRLEPRRLKLAAGDTLEYQAVATDIKSPRPNQIETAPRKILITAPSGLPGSGGKQGSDRNKGSSNDGKAGQSEAGQSAEGQSKPGSSKPDGAKPGEAGEKSEAGSAGKDPAGSDPAGSDSAAQQQSPANKQSGQQQPGKQGEQGTEQGDGGNSASGDDAMPEGGSQPGEGSSQDDAQKYSAAGEQGGESGQGEHADQGANGDQQADEGASSGENGGSQKSVASDGTNDGDAFERILKHRQEQAKPDPPAGEQQPGSDSQAGAGQKPSGQQTEGQQEKNQQRDSKQGKPSGDKEQPGQPSGDKKPGQQQSPQPGQKPQGSDPSQPSPGDAQPKDGQGEKSQSGDQSGQGNSGEKGKSGEKKQGGEQGDRQNEGQSGAKQNDAQQNSNQDSGQGQGGKQQDGTGQADQGEQEQEQGKDGSGQAGQPQKGQAGEGQSESNEQQAGGENAGKPSAGERGQKQDGQDTGGQNSAGQSGGEPSEGDAQPSGEQPSDPRSGATRDNNSAKDGSPQNSDTQGQGAQSQDDPTRGANQKPGQSAEQRKDARGGDGETSKGNSGAGEPSADEQGSPTPQDTNQPREKSAQDNPRHESQNGDDGAQSPSNSKRESDTESNEDGDRSGGGKRGGGQKANQSGTGGAGQNTAADEGADRSEQAGGHETSGRAGKDQQADGRTGESGTQAGPGSRTRKSNQANDPKGGDGSSSDDSTGTGQGQKPAAGDGSKGASSAGNGQKSDQAGGKQGGNSASGEAGSAAGGEKGEQPDGAKASDKSSSGEPTADGPGQSNSGQPDDRAGGQDMSAPTGQGSKSLVPPAKDWEAGTEKADQANLDYTRKATDLAIEHLKDELEQGKNDPELLDRLGWTRQEAEQFVERWETMRKNAQAPAKTNAGGKRQLDEALRSLGLKPQGSVLKGSAARGDRAGGLQESRRTRPPSEYSEAFKAYTQGTARGGK